MKKDAQTSTGFSILYAGIVLIVTFWAYMKTLAPTVSFFDSGELIAAAHTLGIAHPPGYPTYVLLGWFFSKLPLGSVAWRINLMSACFASLASFMGYWISLYMMTAVSHAKGQPPLKGGVPAEPERIIPPVFALYAAAMFAFSPTHWRHAVIAEVYSLNTFFCGLILLVLCLWRRQQLAASDPSQPQRVWLLYLAAWLFGFGFGNHQTISLLSAAACFLVLITAPRILTSLKSLALILLCLLLGLSIYLLLPIRAAQDPALKWGNPVTFKEFKWLVMREGYDHVQRGDGLQTLWNAIRGPAKAGEHEPTGKYPAESEAGLLTRVRRSLFWKQLRSFDPVEEFGYWGIMLALIGLIYGLATARVETAALLIGLVTMVVFIVLIGDPPEENIFLVKEFHAPSYLIVSVWFGLGMMAVARAVLWLVPPAYRKTQYGCLFGLAVYFLLLPGQQVWTHLREVDRRQNYVAYDYAGNVLKSLQPDAILFTWGDSGAFPLWYMQIVEEKRPDVTLLHAPHLTSKWFLESLPDELFKVPPSGVNDERDLYAVIDSIVQKNVGDRPVYFDFSSAHSLVPQYPMVLNGITYKVGVPGDSTDTEIWKRYRFRGILDDTQVAMDPDIRRTFSIYGTAQFELGSYFLEQEQLEEAARHFNLAVRFDPSLGDIIIKQLDARDLLSTN